MTDLEARPGSRRGQAALIIGGTGALGSAVARRLAEEGVHIAFTFGKSSEAASALARDVEACGVGCISALVQIDASEAVADFVATTSGAFGRLHTLVYAAGPSFELAYIGKTSPVEWGRVLDVDVKGCFNAVHACLPFLRETSGSVVAITAAGVERAIAKDILSLAPKAAITALIRGVALEEGRYGVRANCVAPGYIAGGMGKKIMEVVGAEHGAAMVKAVPLKRMGSSEEVADAVAYLSSPQASYITGTTLFVSGGLEL